MKTRKDVADLMDRVFAECQATRESGQKEYAHEEQNALRNFEETGKDLDIPREKVLWIFLKKHLDGIKAHINGHRSQREDVRGRIKDVIVYLILFWAMVDDDGELKEPHFPGKIIHTEGFPFKVAAPNDDSVMVKHLYEHMDKDKT